MGIYYGNEGKGGGKTDVYAEMQDEGVGKGGGNE